MRKLVFGLLLAGVVTLPSYSADVVERTDCKELNAQIAQLTGRDDLTEDEETQLSELQSKHRRDCAARAGARTARTIAKKRSPSTDVPADEKTKVEQDKKEEPVAESAPAVAASCTTPDIHGCCPGEDFEDMGDDGKMCCKGDMCYPPMKTEAEKQAEKEAEIAANIEKGLCGDGTKPNKFGCCTGQKFKDMMDGTFACCPDDGGECVPPMTKGTAL